MSAPANLRVEHLDEPLGLTVPRPRLSWRLPPGTKRQLAYQLRAGEWDFGPVDSDQSLLVPYGGPELRSGQRVEWTVKVWTDAGESDWAEPSWWEMGLLNPDDWTVSWIEPSDAAEAGTQSPHPAWVLRGIATYDRPVERARLYVTAHGIYEFFINGHRIGDAELTPGFTSYKKILQVQTFDVTNLLTPGANVLAAILTGGWIKWAKLYGQTALGLLAQLHVHGVDGSVTRVGTGQDWTASSGAIERVDLQQGQVVDFRKDQPAWNLQGADADVEGWKPVTVRDVALSRLTSSPAPPVRRVQELRPVTISRQPGGRQVVDLGQNINGWIRLTNLGPEGTTLALTHGETLDSHGDVTTVNVWEAGSDDGRSFQLDRVTSAGRPGEVFEPRHTTHGFRYVRIEGHPEELSPDDVTGVVVHTDMRRTGWFECSDERINKLHEAVVWTFRGNACDIPTDCPTRERAGWTGDWQTFIPTAAFLYDVAGFSSKWLNDLAADQCPDGLVRHCAPEFTPLGIQIALNMPPGCAGFADAAVIVPWEMYKAYGDRDLLEKQWRSMTAWVDYAAGIAREGRHPHRNAERPIPQPHEQFLWDTGFHWGEWNEPEMPYLDTDVVHAFLTQLSTTDHGNIATAYLHHSSDLLARMADVLGRDHELIHYRNLADATRAAWQIEFLSSDGTVKPNTQASYVRALAFNLPPDDLRQQMIQHLVDLIRNADTHLGTGFLSTPYLLPTLADGGYIDLAYELLFQETAPSWLTMIDRGATTIWEHWNGVDDSGVARESLNHFSKGAVVSFLHRYTAGIQPLKPGYRRFRVAPTPGGGLTFTRAVHDTPYGEIEASWRIESGVFRLAVRVPAGTTAEVVLPDGRTEDATPGASTYECPNLGTPKLHVH